MSPYRRLWMFWNYNFGRETLFLSQIFSNFLGLRYPQFFRSAVIFITSLPPEFPALSCRTSVCLSWSIFLQSSVCGYQDCSWWYLWLVWKNRSKVWLEAKALGIQFHKFHKYFLGWFGSLVYMRMVFLLITFMLFNKKSVDGMVINEGLQHLDQFFSNSHQNKHRMLWPHDVMT